LTDRELNNDIIRCGSGGLKATMKRQQVRAFISYAHADRLFAGQAQTLLGEVGISAFLAHEDLEVSDEWRECLLRELAQCQLFVSLLSKHYLMSTWAQQESGFIVSRLQDVVVAPLSLDGTRSGGFLSHLQSPNVKSDGITRALLVEPLVLRFPRVILPTLIAEAVKAGSFRHAEKLIAPLVRYFPLFSAEEAQSFAEGAIDNGQIWLAADCKSDYLPAFLAAQGASIRPETLRALSHQVEQGEWYRGD
jgi:hypothetical protein